MSKAKIIERIVTELAPGRVRTNAFMGWQPDLPDERDREFRYGAVDPDRLGAVAIPVEGYDLRVLRQPVFDQGPRGSCTGQSVAGHVAVERAVTPRSALFGYWYGRSYIGETDRDEGAYIRDVIKAANIEGFPRDDLHPDVEENLFRAPSARAETDAEKRRVFSYHRIDAPELQRACLAARHSYVIGFSVYRNFWEAGYNGGLCQMPAGYMDGGHAVLVWGYHDDLRHSIWAEHLERSGVPRAAIPATGRMVRNSYGIDWGMRGRIELFGKPYDLGGNFIVDGRLFDDPYLADDAWTCRKL
jgi:hypothetical protein